MYSKIIVPLDGSVLAEKALPYAVSLVKQLNATLVLLRVEEERPLVVDFAQSPQYDAGNIVFSGNIQPDNTHLGTTGVNVGPTYVTDQYQTVTSYTGQQEDEDYLEKVKGTLVAMEAQTPLKAEQIQTKVVCGRSPKELAAIVEEEHSDLVVMTTHGRSGLSLMVAGSVATNLLHHSSIPLVLIKPDEISGAEKAAKQVINFGLDPIVVALDGTPWSETVLEAATNLALQLGVKIHLLEVVSSIIPIPGGVSGGGGFYYPADYDLDKETASLKEQAGQYLKGIQIRLKDRGVECITAVQSGEPIIPMEYNSEPIARILNYARAVKAQLVAMTTHGRGQVGQVVMGSVAEAVVRESHLPVLLMRKANHPAHIV